MMIVSSVLQDDSCSTVFPQNRTRNATGMQFRLLQCDAVDPCLYCICSYMVSSSALYFQTELNRQTVASTFETLTFEVFVVVVAFWLWG